MIIKLYLYTTPGDLEEEGSIKRLIRETVVPRLGCDPVPVEYERMEEGRQMTVVLQKSGSQKNSVFAGMRKSLESLKKHWARVYRYDIYSGSLPTHENVETRMIMEKPIQIKEENNNGQ